MYVRERERVCVCVYAGAVHARAVEEYERERERARARGGKKREWSTHWAGEESLDQCRHKLDGAARGGHDGGANSEKCRLYSGLLWQMLG